MKPKTEGERKRALTSRHERPDVECLFI